MVDVHSHILPNVDDGSKSVEESLRLLDLLKNQGVECVVATPHFRANREKLSAFLERRNDSFNQLKKEILQDSPKILLGAEVEFYPGISRMNNIESLCIENSKILLLEMPFARWTEFTVKEVIDLANIKNITVVIAHIDRYMKFQNRVNIQRLLNNGILFQANADFFINFFTKRKAISMLINNELHFLGSDCHNTTSRPPLMGEAIDVIKNRCGNHFYRLFTDYSNKMFNRS